MVCYTPHSCQNSHQISLFIIFCNIACTYVILLQIYMWIFILEPMKNTLCVSKNTPGKWYLLYFEEKGTFFTIHMFKPLIRLKWRRSIVVNKMFHADYIYFSEILSALIIQGNILHIYVLFLSYFEKSLHFHIHYRLW